MKRAILSVLIVVLAAIPLQAERRPDITYDFAVATFAEMAELLDQAVYLATGAVLADEKSEIKIYVQGILNLLVGPDSELYDAENHIATEAGLQPLFADLYTPYTEAIPYGALFPDPGAGSPDQAGWLSAWYQVEVTLAKAQSVAQGLIAAPYRYPWEEEVYTLFALLVSVRGGDEDVFPLGGVGALAHMFPSREIEVGSRESIQAAIDRAPTGGVVYVEPGTYREALRIDKSISLIARPAPDEAASELGSVVIDGSLWGCAIWIDSTSPITVSIDGFVIRGNACGISVLHEATVKLTRMRFEDNGTAVIADQGGSILVDRCTFSANERAVRLRFGSQGEILDSIIENGTGWNWAIDVSCSQLTIRNCDIRDNMNVAINLGPTDYTVLHLVDNRILRNGTGLKAARSYCLPEYPADLPEYPPESATSYGTATGWGNVIPGPGEADGNHDHAIDTLTPYRNAASSELDLSFLTEPKPEAE